jgi:hypothetical protein
MRILIFRIIIGCVLMLYSGSASAQHWEILRGVKDFYPDARSTSCFIYANNDSLFSYLVNSIAGTIAPRIFPR